MSRNQKATVLASAFYVLAFAFFIWGAMVSQETRVTGTIAKRQVDIPIYLQSEPEYVGLKNTKVYQGWGVGRLLLWGVLGVGSALTGLALSTERRAELVKERIKFKAECRETDQQAKLDSAYRLSLDHQMKERTGETVLALHEDRLVAEADATRELNGWEAPEQPKPPHPLPPPQLRNLESTAENGRSPEELLKAELEALTAAARDRLAKQESDRPDSDRPDSDRPDSDRPDSTVPDTRFQLYQERGEKIKRSLASLKMSILSAAPTGAGKTHLLYQWLSDLRALYPQNEVYVIAHKYDSFLGLLEAGKVAIFDDLLPQKALKYLDKVYDIMKERLGKKENERKQFEFMPVRLVLDDWFASYGVLKLDPALWNIVKTKIGAIITKGREANVCLYIATQSFNLEALGMQDSNIRGNLAITCQGLVTEKLNEWGELVEQGNYETLQLLIANKFIVASKQDRERLNAELDELVALSRLHQVPAIFSAVGKPTLGLVPYYERPVGDEGKDDNLGSTNVAILDRNPDDSSDDLPQITDEQARRWAMEFDLRSSNSEAQTQSEQPGESAQNNDRMGVSDFEQAQTHSEQPESEQPIAPELVDWYRWLPTKEEVIKLLENNDANLYNFPSFVRSKLKKSETSYNRKTKNAIVKLLITLKRFDLIDKYQIDPSKYPLSEYPNQ
jgi:hypothetical protein